MRSNLRIWDAHGKTASPSVVPGPFLAESGFLSSWAKGPALALRTFSYVQLFPAPGG